MLVKSGSVLLVPRAAHADDVAEHIADHGTLALAPALPPLRRVQVKAGRKGDSVAALAKRYRVSASQLAQWNGVSTGARFKSGQTVVVMLPAARAAANAQTPRKAKATPTRSIKATASTGSKKAASGPRARTAKNGAAKSAGK
jgi:membrane-bound lytic murein transglycosylase D